MKTAFVRTGFWTCAFVVLALALAPAKTPLPTTGWDKTNHLLAFGTLAVLGLWAYPGRTSPVLLGLLAYGVLIEGLQSFTPDRLPEWADLLADSFGLLLGFVVAEAVKRHAGLHRAAKNSQQP